jgi:iron complex outermembrane receptor protein
MKKTKFKKSQSIAVLLTATCAMGAARGADAPAAPSAGEATPLDTVIVTGTRVTGIKAEDSVSPIQVLDVEALTNTGQPDLMQALGVAMPSMQVEAYGADTAALTKAIRLRGLSPNDTLVLVNGKRRHGTANLTVDTGSPFIGSAAPDFGLIPAAAIDHVEILTDGAAAQYGTDAIAGVVNIILKKQDSGGTLSAEAGQYIDGGGDARDVSANAGFKPWDGGYANLTAEYRTSDYSNRGAVDPRVVDPANLKSMPSMSLFPGWPNSNLIFGDPLLKTSLITLNMGSKIVDDIEFYGNVTYAHKYARAYENYRLPNKLPQVYPLGFNPSEGIEEDDAALSAGVKGTLVGWEWDISSTFGRDVDHVGTYNSVNPQEFTNLGFTPTSFNDGEFHASQWTNNLDIDRDFQIGWASPLNVAFGLEQRTDTFKIVAGDGSSRYLAGPSSFPGFGETDAGSHQRTNDAFYVDLAVSPLAKWTVDAAGRIEHYSDVGNATVGKVSSKYDIVSNFAVRGTISSGFRAPTLAEEYYSATNVGPSTAFVQLPPNSPGAKLVGIDGLKPEKSNNYSLGFVLKPSNNSSVSLDAYQIAIHNRVVGSGNVFGSFDGVIQSPAVNAAIAANGNSLDPAVISSPIGQTGINIFSNAANTKTRGIDLVASLSSSYGSLGHVDWTASASYNNTGVTQINQAPAQLAPQTLLDKTAISQLETASPHFRLNAGADWKLASWTLNVQEQYFSHSSEYQLGDDGNYYQNTVSAKFITNLAVSKDLYKSFTVTVGANNLFNVYPDLKNSALLANLNSSGDNAAVQKYVNWSPIGINGGFYYARLSYKF